MLISCSICSDWITGNDSESICCIPCGHMFHYICLMNWFESVKSCPQCHQRASENNIVRLVLSLGTTGGDDEETPEILNRKVDNLSFQIQLKDLDIKNLKEANEKLKSQNNGLRAHVKTVEDQIRLNTTVVKSWEDQVKLLKTECKELSLKLLEAEEYKKEIESLKQRLEEDLDHAEKEVVKWKNNCLSLQKTNESLSNVTSPKSSILKRTMFENPAPDNLIGRNLDTDSPLNVTTYDLTTPSPVEVPKVDGISSSLSQASTSSSTSSSSVKSSPSMSSDCTILSDDLTAPPPFEVFPKVRSFMKELNISSFLSQASTSSSTSDSDDDVL